jgi:lipopolysaccharide export system permease protein
VGYAVLIFFVYINLLIAGKTWIEKGVTPEWLGLWWVHAVVAGLAMGILYLPRWTARARYRRNMARMTAGQSVPA